VAFAGLISGGFTLIAACALVGGWLGLAGIVVTVVVLAACGVSRG
jgi:hypothetical protein